MIAVAGGAEKTKQADWYDHVIDHQINSDWVDEVREFSNGGVDVAHDPVGGTLLTKSGDACGMATYYRVCCDTRFTC